MSDIRGLPKFRFYRQLIEDLEYPFRRQMTTEEENHELISRLGQLADALPEEFLLFVESFALKAKVLEVRRYGVKDHYRYETVQYEGPALDCSTAWSESVRMLVRYDRNGRLVDFTFPHYDCEPMRFTSWLCSRECTNPGRWEDVIDYLCDEERFDGMFVTSESRRSAINVGGDGRNYDLEWWPANTELFRIVSEKKLFHEALRFAKTFMKEGTSAALDLHGDWSAIHDDSDRPERCISLSSILTAWYMRAQRQDGPQWLVLIKMLEACDVRGNAAGSLQYSAYVPNGTEEAMMQDLYEQAKVGIANQNFGEKDSLSWQKLLYLALRGHDLSRADIEEAFNWIDTGTGEDLWSIWTGRIPSS